MSRYIIHFLISSVLLSGAIAGFNWWMDPYAIYHKQAPQQSQPLVVMNERVFKTVGLAHTPSDVVILGTSRADLGIGREHEAFKGKRVISLATFGQTIRESRRLMEVAVKDSKPKIVILGLDFFVFNALFAPPLDFVEENYSPSRAYHLMLSINALTHSWTVMRRKIPDESDLFDADGFRIPRSLSRLAGGYRESFSHNERSYLLEKYLPYPNCRFAFSSNRYGSSLEDFRAIVRLAHQQHIDLRLFISPSHARQWETLAISGLWQQWEEWKREMVRITDTEARMANAESFGLWDFSGYDDISTEVVPASGDKTTIMHWYSDSAHYTPDLGKIVIQRMFMPVTQDGWKTWGAVINSSNVERHLDHIRMVRTSYRATHQQDIAEIENTARTVGRIKRCPATP